MMSAKLPSLSLTIEEEALRDATEEEELATDSSNRSESDKARGDATEKQRKMESKSRRRASC